MAHILYSRNKMKKENTVQSCDFRFSFVILRYGRVGGPLVDLEEEDIELLLRVCVCVYARESAEYLA
jgi:hypothetical protein